MYRTFYAPVYRITERTNEKKENAWQTLQDKLQSESIARKIAERSLEDLDKEKRVLQHEWEQSIVRHSQEVDMKNNIISEVSI